METITSLKSLVATYHIKRAKLKEFGLDKVEYELLIDVSDIPNPLSYPKPPDLVSKNGSIIKFDSDRGEKVGSEGLEGDEVKENSDLLFFSDDFEFAQSPGILQSSQFILDSEH
ncbi:hypothetical protein KGF56_003458 [Candida oxycetoniae]|uniref:Uncharacterized protein n=1 Tax=Candida oxycetoniae TaxID=497107 RepID=A0AAI9SVA2_9ASCO|nr:uncharacterized protein KGF56_003458 [Candida oxycetoniae]KAI3403733.2 hypothetical protein KGF56_003458 [Candida oxycetoniae]